MIEIRLLGRMMVDGSVRLTASELGGGKPRQLLALLALDVGHPVPKDVLADRLWEQRPPGGCITTLESYVCLLRRKLHVSAGRHGVIATSHGGYLLDPDHARVDLADVRVLLAGGYPSVFAALHRVTGDLLADEPYSTWAEEARTAFADEVVTACTRASQEANGAGDHATAVRLATEATGRACFSEPAVRELMRGLIGVGDRTGALRVYEGLRERLAAELGVDVGPQTRALFLQALQEDRDAGRGCDRAEASALVRLLRSTVDTNPDVLAGMPGARALIQALQGLPSAV